jgi:hypothetical protein
MQARTKIAVHTKLSVKPWPYRYPRSLLQYVVDIRVRVFRRPVRAAACNRSKNFLSKSFSISISLLGALAAPCVTS